MSNQESVSLFKILSIKRRDLKKTAESLKIPTERLKYYEKHQKFPSPEDLKKICHYYNIDATYLKLKMAVYDDEVLHLLSKHAEDISKLIKKPSVPEKNTIIDTPQFTTKRGKLYQEDCIKLMKNLQEESIDLIFADPPFNLNKLYPSKIDDNLKEEKYLKWFEKWVYQCTRILAFGGSLFIWNLPKWNTHICDFLNKRLTFKHWIAVDIKYSLPIQGRLYPSHYSLLYYVKGEKAKTFKPDRLSMEICPKCYNELKDYGGYKNKMNPLGINLTDVWYDIPPVRHSKYKRRNGANELSIKLMDRIIEMASEEGDTVFDPFGGSGTTYIVSEIKKRNWLGVEIGPLTDIINRFERIDEEKEFISSIRANLNALFPPKIYKKREEQGLWTPESVRKQKTSSGQLTLSNL